MARTALALLAGASAVILGLPGTVAGAGSSSPSIGGAWVGAGRSTPSNGTLLVVIAGPGPVVDPNVAFTLTANVAGGVRPYAYFWTSPLFGLDRNATWTVVMPPGSNTTVDLRVASYDGWYGETNMSFSVGSPLAIHFSVPEPVSEVRRPIPLSITVIGGVPPYLVNWSTQGRGSSGSVVTGQAGTFLEPLWVNISGTAWVAADVHDHAGGRASDSGPDLSLIAWPAINASLSPQLVEAGGPFSLNVIVSGGIPPLEWSIEPLGPIGNTSADFGRLMTDGSVQWTGTLENVGNASLVIATTDSVGAEVSVDIAIPAAPPLAAALALLNLSAQSSSAVVLSASIAGGVPPYRYLFALSDGEGFVGNLSSGGPVSWTAEPSRPGFLAVRLTVYDAIGYRASATGTVLIGGAGAGSTPSPLGSSFEGALVIGIVAGLLGVTVGGALVFWSTHRRPTPAPVVPDPDLGPTLELVRRLLAESDGTDRETLEYQAEQAGVDPDRLRSALERLVALGQVRTEPGPDGEVFVWVGTEASSKTFAGPAAVSGEA